MPLLTRGHRSTCKADTCGGHELAGCLGPSRLFPAVSDSHVHWMCIPRSLLLFGCSLSSPRVRRERGGASRMAVGHRVAARSVLDGPFRVGILKRRQGSLLPFPLLFSVWLLRCAAPGPARRWHGVGLVGWCAGPGARPRSALFGLPRLVSWPLVDLIERRARRAWRGPGQPAPRGTLASAGAPRAGADLPNEHPRARRLLGAGQGPTSPPWS
mgnify:CR=1 FL=1